jgi:hypothetical protein
MFRKTIKIVFKIFFGLVALAALLLIYFNIPVWSENKEAKLGVTFSSLYSSEIGLNWKENYLAALDDLKVRKIRIPVYWNLTEKESGRYDFSDIDWQIEEAGKRGAEIILVVGQKVPRWPECHIPEWLENDDQKRKEDLLKFVGAVVERYKSRKEIKYWQVENEPFLPFGNCPPLDVELLDKEIALARGIDPTRPVVVTDSGELSFWIEAAKRADIFGTTMYRTIYNKKIGYFDYPIGPRFFQFKAYLNKILAHQENNIVVELQTEPWISGFTTNMALDEQLKSMDAQKLKDNVIFARQVGFGEIYLWGAEWWYWMKVNQNHPELWDTAKYLFDENK